LHLLGYDHAEPEEHATMFGLQDRLLASWRAGRVAELDRSGAGQSGADHNGAGQGGPDQPGIVDGEPERPR
jgi:hypothetical protein